MKKIIILVYLIVSSFILFGLQTIANNTIVLKSAKIYIVEDFTFKVDINLETVENLVGFQFKLEYLEEYELVSVSLGDRFTEGRLTYNSNSENNTITFVYVDVNNAITSDLETLVSLEFTAPSVLESDNIEFLTFDNSYFSEFVYMSTDYQLTKNNFVNGDFENLQKAIIGDVNLDGEISLIDVATIQLHLAKFQTLTGINFRVADINNDNELDISDAARIQLFLANLVDTL